MTTNDIQFIRQYTNNGDKGKNVAFAHSVICQRVIYIKCICVSMCVWLPVRHYWMQKKSQCAKNWFIRRGMCAPCIHSLNIYWRDRMKWFLFFLCRLPQTFTVCFCILPLTHFPPQHFLALLLRLNPCCKISMQLPFILSDFQAVLHYFDLYVLYFSLYDFSLSLFIFVNFHFQICTILYWAWNLKHFYATQKKIIFVAGVRLFVFFLLLFLCCTWFFKHYCVCVCSIFHDQNPNKFARKWK